MSSGGLFSFEALVILLSAFIILRGAKSVYPLHFMGFKKYNPKQIEFQIIDFVLKMMMVLVMSGVVLSAKWTLTGVSSLSIFPLLLVAIGVFFIGKFSIDICWSISFRSDPFVIILSFGLSLMVTLQFAPFDITQNPLVFLLVYLLIFFGAQAVWYTELSEMVIFGNPISNAQRLASTVRGYTETLTRPSLVYAFVTGFCPVYLWLLVYRYLNLIHSASLIGLIGLGIFVSSARLSNSWAIADSMKTPHQPFHQANVLIRYYSLIVTSIFQILLATFTMTVHAYLHATKLEISSMEIESVREDIERLLITGDYMNAAKLIRQSSVGNAVIMSFLPAAETVREIADGLLWTTLVIYTVQSIVAVSIRRLKLEMNR